MKIKAHNIFQRVFFVVCKVFKTKVQLGSSLFWSCFMTSLRRQENHLQKIHMPSLRLTEFFVLLKSIFLRVPEMFAGDKRKVEEVAGWNADFEQIFFVTVTNHSTPTSVAFSHSINSRHSASLRLKILSSSAWLLITSYQSKLSTIGFKLWGAWESENILNLWPLYADCRWTYFLSPITCCRFGANHARFPRFTCCL